MLGNQNYTGPWGKEQTTTSRVEAKDPYWYGPQGYRTGARNTMSLRPGVTQEHGKFYQNQRNTQTVADLPWYMQGEGGGMLGRRRAEVEGINSQEMYGLSAPSVRKTTEGLLSSFEEDAARGNMSPAMAAMMRRNTLGGELEGLGSAAGQAASSAYGMKQQGLSDLSRMEAGLGQAEMAGRRGEKASRTPLKLQSRRFGREDRLQRESQDRLKKFWEGMGGFGQQQKPKQAGSSWARPSYNSSHRTQSAPNQSGLTGKKIKAEPKTYDHYRRSMGVGPAFPDFEAFSMFR